MNLSENSSNELYLDLLKKCLTRSIFEDSFRMATFPLPRFFAPIRKLLAVQPFRVARQWDPKKRLEGRGWPLDAETMIGMKRLNNVHFCIKNILNQQIPGDFIETGVWRGGTTIFMRACLKAYSDRQRRVWVADSFQGLPKPNSQRYPQDKKDTLWSRSYLSVSLENVKRNFERYGLLDEQVQFLKGWFRDTLPRAPIHQLSLLRLDGDLYESTMDALESLYKKLSVGGYIIIDDFGAIAACQAAVMDFRSKHGIVEAVEPIDETGVFWKKLHGLDV